MPSRNFLSAFEYFEKHELPSLLAISENSSEDDVLRTLSSRKKGLKELAVLISPAAQKHLPLLIEHARKLTHMRFGKAKRIYAPLYVSSECYNICTYCGFSMDVPLPRKTLTIQEVMEEARILKERGIDSILIVSGEAPRSVNTEYLLEVIRNLRPSFSYIAIEVQPLPENDYHALVLSGLDSVVVYQETYHRQIYSEVHLKGRKKNYMWRISTPERAARAGVYKVGMGILLGLAPWRYDALCLAFHLNFMKKHYWQSAYSVSFPRLRPCAREFSIRFPVSDTDFLQIISAFRIWDEDLEIVISTRERPSFRDLLCSICVTTLSAGSSTEPGGYSAPRASLAQFDIDDTRTVEEVVQALEQMGYEPVFKDWDSAFCVHLAQLLPGPSHP